MDTVSPQILLDKFNELPPDFQSEVMSFVNDLTLINEKQNTSNTNKEEVGNEVKQLVVNRQKKIMENANTNKEWADVRKEISAKHYL